jgi:secretion/DNA translocation related TadE-like protein
VHWRDEGGSGSVLGVALIGAIVGLLFAVAPLYAVLAARSNVASAADAAALAAADARVGVTTGFPCERAAEVAAANGATLTECEVDGLIATVSVGVTILGFEYESTATAGPPQ